MGQVLEFTPEVDRETAAIHERVKTVIPQFEWQMHAPYIAAINRLKKEKGLQVAALASAVQGAHANLLQFLRSHP